MGRLLSIAKTHYLDYIRRTRTPSMKTDVKTDNGHLSSDGREPKLRPTLTGDA